MDILLPSRSLSDVAVLAAQHLLLLAPVVVAAALAAAVAVPVRMLQLAVVAVMAQYLFGLGKR
jgi:hypothetical protein